MGLFSTKKKIYVASSVYNLAGDITQRSDFTKTAIVSNLMRSTSYKVYLGESLVRSYLSGPSIKQQQLYRWAKSGFSLGSPSVEVTGASSIDGSVVEPEIPVDVGNVAEVNRVSLETADFFYWAEQYLIENDPGSLSSNWTADIDSSTLEVTIEFEDTSTVSFTATGYNKDSRYIYAYYDEVTPEDPPIPEERVANLFIYEIGSGNLTLDALDELSSPPPEYYPFIPMRLSNKPISHADYSSVFADCEKAYSLATDGRKITDLLELIEDNENIDDVDHCYMVFGVPLNTAQNESRSYLYAYFKGLIAYQVWGDVEYQAWVSSLSDDDTDVEPAITTIRVKSDDALVSSYDMRMSWVTIDESVGSGLGKVDAEVGEYWFEKLTDIEFSGSIRGSSMPRTYLWHQISASSWRRLELRGMIHLNYVYGGKSIEISTNEALDDEDESGFVVPMHYPTIKSISLKESTDIAIENSLLIFNSYQVVKIKWYQRGLFKVIFAIVVAVTVAFFAPAGVGLLGAHAAVGAAVGLTGLSAVLVGAAINALAAMILTSVIDVAATELLGDELGGIISAVISFVVMNFSEGSIFSGDWHLNWGSMMRAENLLKLTQVGAQAVTGYAATKIEDIQEDLIGLTEDYEDDMAEIEKRTMELLGYSGVAVDALRLNQVQGSSIDLTESSDTFIRRSLLTGSDIAHLSFSMIDSFSDITLDLPMSIK